jgi:glycosyltransferase involved in cell wall biosynthesis
MRIGVDATGWTNKRGHGRFARGAVGKLIELDVENSYTLYTDAQGGASIDPPGSAELRVVALRRPVGEATAAGSSRSPADLFRMTRAVHHDRPDAFFFPSVYTWFPVVGVRSAVGVHDVTARLMPELTLSDRRARALWRVKEAWAIRAASVVFTVSEASRAAVVQSFGLQPDRVPIVFEAPDVVFAPSSGTPGFDLQRGSFLLFVGGVSPHKNLGTLLDAYAALVQTRDDAPPLVIVGELEHDPYLSASREVHSRIDSLGLGSRVRLTGFVSDEQLAALYGSATATVLPSLAEGFDLPAVEAAACGSPVVLSDLGPHRETLGDAGLFFPATDTLALTEALARGVGDAVLRARMSADSRAAVARLSWEVAAQTLRGIVRDLVAPAGREAGVVAA